MHSLLCTSFMCGETIIQQHQLHCWFLSTSRQWSMQSMCGQCCITRRECGKEQWVHHMVGSCCRQLNPGAGWYWSMAPKTFIMLTTTACTWHFVNYRLVTSVPSSYTHICARTCIKYNRVPLWYKYCWFRKSGKIHTHLWATFACRKQSLPSNRAPVAAGL